MIKKALIGLTLLLSAQLFAVESQPAYARPSRQIDLKYLCVCRNGSVEAGNACIQLCENLPATEDAILYVKTVVGPDIALNPKLGNLYNWCNVQLESDETVPQCSLRFSDDENNVVNVPVTLKPYSNSFTAVLNVLDYNKPYKMILRESKSSGAKSNPAWILRSK